MSQDRGARSGSPKKPPGGAAGKDGDFKGGLPNRSAQIPKGLLEYYGVRVPDPASGAVQMRHAGVPKGWPPPAGILEYYGIVPKAPAEAAQGQPALPHQSRDTDQAPPVDQAAPLQAKAGGPLLEGTTELIHQAAAQGTAGPSGPLPHLDQIQRSFGRHDVSHVKAHTDAQAAQAASTMGAEAFATGDHVAFAGTPSLHTAAHETAHVVQQRAGVHLKGGIGEAGDVHEQKADAVADLVVPGRSAEALLDETAKASPPPAGAAAPPSSAKPDSAATSGGQAVATEAPEAATHQGETPATGVSPGPHGLEATEPATLSGPAGPAAPVGPAASGGAKAESAPGPEAPKTAQEDPAFQALGQRLGEVTAAQKQHAPSTAKVRELHAAAKPPADEVQGQAEGRQVGRIAAEKPKRFSREAFVKALMERLAAIKPKSLEAADSFGKSGTVGQVRGQLTQTVQKEEQAAGHGMAERATETPPTTGLSPKPVTPLPKPEAEAATGKGKAGLAVGAAQPKPRTDNDLQLSELSGADMDERMKQAKVTEPQLERSGEPTFVEAVTAKRSAQAQAKTEVQAYRQTEAQVLQEGKTQAETKEQAALGGMARERLAGLERVGASQTTGKTREEHERVEVVQHLRGIFQKAKSKVDAALGALKTEVQALFDQGAEAARQIFEKHVDEKMAAFKKARYGEGWDVGGWINRGVDWATGLPKEVDAFYEEGQRLFIVKMNEVVGKIAGQVEKRLNEAQSEVEKGREEVDKYVHGLPASLKKVGASAKAEIDQEFGTLEQNIQAQHDELLSTLAENYNAQVQRLESRIQELKESQKGFLDKARELLDQAIDMISGFGTKLREVLGRAAGIIWDILQDPIGFLGNLITGVKQGLGRFTANIGAHLQEGLMGWLAGSLSGAGLTLPATFDGPGILGMVLGVLGLDYAGIRARAVKVVGSEERVAQIEEASELFQSLRSGGMNGLWEEIKERVGDLKETLLGEVQSYVQKEVIEAGILWIMKLLIPGAGFIKAVIGIYDIVHFFVTRATQVMEFVNAVVDSLEAIVGGAVDAMASKIETALAKALPLVIGLLASLARIDRVVDQVKVILAKMRGKVEKAIDWVVKKVEGVVKKVKDKFSGKRKPQDPDAEENRDHQGEPVEVPKTLVEPHPVTLEKPSEKLAAELGQVKGRQVIYESGGASNPKQATQHLLKEHPDAKFDTKSGRLTLPPLKESPLEHAQSLRELGSTIAHQTGVPRVEARRDSGRVVFDASINPTVKELVTYLEPSEGFEEGDLKQLIPICKDKYKIKDGNPREIMALFLAAGIKLKEKAQDQSVHGTLKDVTLGDIFQQNKKDEVYVEETLRTAIKMSYAEGTMPPKEKFDEKVKELIEKIWNHQVHLIFPTSEPRGISGLGEGYFWHREGEKKWKRPDKNGRALRFGADQGAKHEVHHVIPLYLGGGNDLLMSVEGSAKPEKENGIAKLTAHLILHQLFDNLLLNGTFITTSRHGIEVKTKLADLRGNVDENDLTDAKQSPSLKGEGRVSPWRKAFKGKLCLYLGIEKEDGSIEYQKITKRTDGSFDFGPP